MRLSAGTRVRRARALVLSTAAAALVAACGSATPAQPGAAAARRAPASAAGLATAIPGSASPAASPTPHGAATPRATDSPAGRESGHRGPTADRASARQYPSPAGSALSPPAPRPAPRPTTRATPTSVPATGLAADEAQVLRLVNTQRASAGCGPLQSSAVLVGVARAHSKDMAVHGYFDHNSQDGRTPFDRMRAAGYRGGLMGENIAAGQPTAAAVMDAWMHSPGHRANILNCGFKAIGIGVFRLATSPFHVYWTQDFGDR